MSGNQNSLHNKMCCMHFNVRNKSINFWLIDFKQLPRTNILTVNPTHAVQQQLIVRVFCTHAEHTLRNQ